MIKKLYRTHQKRKNNQRIKELNLTKKVDKLLC